MVGTSCWFGGRLAYWTSILRNDIKSDLVERIAIDFPQISVMVDKYIRYKFIMKIQDLDILKSLDFSVTLLFLNREDRFQKMRPNPDEV